MPADTGPLAAASLAAMMLTAPAAAARADRAPAPVPGSSTLAHPAPTGFTFDRTGGRETFLVLGRRPHFRAAPAAGYGGSRAPWEVGTAIRDTMTGADTAAFGNAYNLGSPLGSDERGNETGGPFIAPRHD